MKTFKERCQAVLDQIRQDGMLRQGSAVDTLVAFVVSERGRAEFPPPAQDGLYPLVLYFGNAADRDEMIRACREAKPGMVARRVP